MPHKLPDAVLLILSAVLTVAMVQDAMHRKIPNTLTLAGALTGLGLSLAPAGIGLGASCLGGMVGLLVFGFFHVHQLLGAGDAKLLSAIGFFTGFPDILGVALCTLIAGGLLSLFWAAWRGQLRPAWANLQAFWQLRVRKIAAPAEPLPGFTPTPERLPYAIAIAAGAWWHMASPWPLF